jgi:hypothetical protein
MLALLPLLLTFAPDLARWIAGDKAGAVATKAAEVAGAVLGTTDPAEAAVAIQDPGKAMELRLALAKVAADAEGAKRQAELDTLRAEFADAANARARDIALRGTGQRNVRADVMVALTVIGIFGSIFALKVGSFPQGSSVEGAVLGLIGLMSKCFADAFGFEFSTSRGAREQREFNEKLTNKLVDQQGTTPAPAAIATTAPVTVNQPSPAGTTADDLNTASLRAARGG